MFLVRREMLQELEALARTPTSRKRKQWDRKKEWVSSRADWKGGSILWFCLCSADELRHGAGGWRDDKDHGPNPLVWCRETAPVGWQVKTHSGKLTVYDTAEKIIHICKLACMQTVREGECERETQIWSFEEVCCTCSTCSTSPLRGMSSFAPQPGSLPGEISTPEEGNM